MNLFNQSKYTIWYYSIIEKAQVRTLDSSVYTERHHIIPKSLGGSNKKENLVVLTAREHFICHWLLTKMTDDARMKRAFWRMLTKSNSLQKRYLPNSKTYNLLRQKYGKPNLGKPMSDEAKAKLSASRKGQPTWNKGLPRTEQEKNNISLACKKSIKPPRHPHKESTLKLLTLRAQNRIRVVCEHCNTSCQPSNYTRWHGERCRFKVT
jgi:hypothetical protein